MSTVINGVPHVPAESAAAALGTTHLKILMLLKKGQLAGSCLEGAWYVSVPSLEGYREEEPLPQGSGCRTGCSGCGCH